MIGDLTAGISVTFPDMDTEGMSDVVRATVVEKESEHTFITTEHYGVPKHFSTGIRTGAPVLVSTSSRYGRKTWPAYVVDVRPKSTTKNSEDVTEVRALGVTYPAKKTSTKVFNGATIGEYINEIVYGLGLTPFVEDTPIRQTVPQAGRSDWELLRDLCSIGDLRLFATGTTLHALTNAGSISTFFDEAPTLYYLPRDQVLSQPDALDSLIHSRHDMERTQVQARGVDPTTAKVLSATAGDGLFTDFGTSMSANSLTDLKTKVNRKARTAYATYTARTSGPGNVLVSAGKPVYLNDSGVGKWWLVDEVTHRFVANVGTFTTDAVLWRDSSFPTEPAPPEAPLRTGSRSTSRFCTCREYEPLLVGALRSNYITNQEDTPSTEQTYLTTEEVAKWLESSPVWQQQPRLMGSEIDTRRWRARGRCDWQ